MLSPYLLAGSMRQCALELQKRPGHFVPDAWFSALMTDGGHGLGVMMGSGGLDGCCSISAPESIHESGPSGGGGGSGGSSATHADE
jgi:hypothetical protein